MSITPDTIKEQQRVYAIAYAIAERAHAGQFRHLPDARPYFEHVKDVAAMMPTWELKTVAILHDAIEDTTNKPAGIKVTEDSLKTAGIPLHIVQGVVAMTKPEGADYEQYIQEKVKGNEMARAVKLADNYVNLKDRLAALIAGDTTAEEKVHKYGLSLKMLTEPKK
jgi:(p)ppGpp synthase/HD superfamily hydrolase